MHYTIWHAIWSQTATNENYAVPDDTVVTIIKYIFEIIKPKQQSTVGYNIIITILLLPFFSTRSYDHDVTLMTLGPRTINTL